LDFLLPPSNATQEQIPVTLNTDSLLPPLRYCKILPPHRRQKLGQN
jgi:hypothetical protein